MSDKRVYAVFLTDGAVEELGPPFSVFITNKDGEAYIRAVAVDPDGNYYQMTVEQEVLPGTTVEIDLQIHHEFVKGSVLGTESATHELGVV